MSYVSFKSKTTSAVHISTPICPEISTHSKPSSIKLMSLFSIAFLINSKRGSSSLNIPKSISLQPVTVKIFILIKHSVSNQKNPLSDIVAQIGIAVLLTYDIYSVFLLIMCQQSFIHRDSFTV